ncbi:BT_3928 family protein [Robertkochia aurantiaca]|uniref:BT_3928 family protein n=1 Tax=Robertkochia aurantiaca TaxID=2873700 RepID=UPI001CCA36E1|nr:BT_3928 family protein [Robertkochia sp. 3YJGBD-33]
MKILVTVFRLLTGVIFIFSGLIKMNDPVGFAFKLEEYFSPSVLNLEFLMPYALALAVILVILEVLLGVLLLLGTQVKLTVWSLFLMILFFTFLTFYSAYYNKVTDCGCFGDAIKLTPWESFFKDVVLLIMIVVLLIKKELIRPWLSPRTAKSVRFLTILGCVLFTYYVIAHLPLIDFRPYHVGADIREGMTIPEDAPKPVYAYHWKFRVNGKDTLITTKGSYPEVDGEYLEVTTEEIQAGYQPPIHDFTMERNGADHTAELLTEPKLLMVVSRVVSKADKEAFEALKPVIERAKQSGYTVIGMSASSQQEIREAGFLSDIPFYFCDLTTLKTIVRSNPGVLKLSEGVIQQKVHYNDLEELEF